MKSELVKTLHVPVSKSLYDHLVKLAHADDRSLASYVRVAIVAATKYKEPDLLSVLAPYTDEE